MKLRYPATCVCGERLEPGTDVRMERQDPDPAATVFERMDRPTWVVVACPRCSDSCDRGAVDMSCQNRTTTMADAIRNRRAREAKRRAKGPK